MKRIIEKIKKFFSKTSKNICPDCGGELKCEMLDVVFDCLVYKCSNCGKRWM